MTELTEQRLSEIQARCDAATPGPWEIATNAYRESTGQQWGWIKGPSNNWCWSDRYPKDRANAEFAAHARQDIPDLLAQHAADQAALAESKRREQAAVEDMEQMAYEHDSCIGCKDWDGSNCNQNPKTARPCWEWRGSQECGEGGRDEV